MAVAECRIDCHCVAALPRRHALAHARPGRTGLARGFVVRRLLRCLSSLFCPTQAVGGQSLLLDAAPMAGQYELFLLLDPWFVFEGIFSGVGKVVAGSASRRFGSWAIAARTGADFVGISGAIFERGTPTFVAYHAVRGGASRGAAALTNRHGCY